MSKDREDKTLGERIEELWSDVVEALESLVTPEPQLVPVPVRSGPRMPPRRRRRR